MRTHHRTGPLLTATALTFGVLLATPAVAPAQPAYPAPPARGEVSAGTVTPGRPVTFTGRGYRGHERVRFSYRYSGGARYAYIASRNAARYGTVRFVFRTRSVGTVVLRAQGTQSGRESTAVVRVVRRAAGGASGRAVLPGGGTAGGVSGGAGLPVTGHDARGIALGGTALLLMGTVVAAATRRRRA